MKKLLCLGLIIQYLFAGSYAGLLYHGNCIACHEITQDKSAPSIVRIQMVYKNAFSSQDAFVEYMSQWVYAPNEQTSLMQDAIEQYGLMPHLAYDKEVLREISLFIYQTDFSLYKH